MLSTPDNHGPPYLDADEVDFMNIEAEVRSPINSQTTPFDLNKIIERLSEVRMGIPGLSSPEVMRIALSPIMKFLPELPNYQGVVDAILSSITEQMNCDLVLQTDMEYGDFAVGLVLQETYPIDPSHRCKIQFEHTNILGYTRLSFRGVYPTTQRPISYVAISIQDISPSNLDLIQETFYPEHDKLAYDNDTRTLILSKSEGCGRSKKRYIQELNLSKHGRNGEYIFIVSED